MQTTDEQACIVVVSSWHPLRSALRTAAASTSARRLLDRMLKPCRPHKFLPWASNASAASVVDPRSAAPARTVLPAGGRGYPELPASPSVCGVASSVENPIRPCIVHQRRRMGDRGGEPLRTVSFTSLPLSSAFFIFFVTFSSYIDGLQLFV